MVGCWGFVCIVSVMGGRLVAFVVGWDNRIDRGDLNEEKFIPLIIFLN